MEADAIACRSRTAFAGPWCSGRRSSDGQTIFAMITRADDHGFDLRFWVELRGFEPLTPSMRMRAWPVNAGLAAGGESRESVQPVRADVPPQVAFPADPPRRMPRTEVLSRQRMANK